jgi:nitrate reductase gamma subunit
MKTAFTAPSKHIAKTAASQTIAGLVNKDLWGRAAMFLCAVALLFYLWHLVHLSEHDMTAVHTGRRENESLAEVYTVYACALMLFVGISVLWR